MPGSRFTAARWATIAVRSSGSSRLAFSGRLRVSVATGRAMSSDGRVAMSLLTAQLTESRTFLSPLDRCSNFETEFVAARIRSRRRSRARRCHASYRSQPLDERARVHRPRLPRDFAAALKNDQRRDASDTVATGDLLGTLGVELRKSHAGFKLRGRPRKVRRHRAARPAPRGPEIDDDGDLASVDLGIEISRSEFDRVAVEEALLAVSANRAVADARFGHPVNGIAERAGEVNGRIHGSGF